MTYINIFLHWIIFFFFFFFFNYNRVVKQCRYGIWYRWKNSYPKLLVKLLFARKTNCHFWESRQPYCHIIQLSFKSFFSLGRKHWEVESWLKNWFYYQSGLMSGRASGHKQSTTFELMKCQKVLIHRTGLRGLELVSVKMPSKDKDQC